MTWGERRRRSTRLVVEEDDGQDDGEEYNPTEAEVAEEEAAEEAAEDEETRYPRRNRKQRMSDLEDLTWTPNRGGKASTGGSRARKKGYDGDDTDDDAVAAGANGAEGGPPARPIEPPIENPETVKVDAESLSDLASAYCILRSFSWQLRLSPFSLRDLVCSMFLDRPTNVVDEVHLSILRALILDEAPYERVQVRACDCNPPPSLPFSPFPSPSLPFPLPLSYPNAVVHPGPTQGR